jgi:hypothetical protein
VLERPALRGARGVTVEQRLAGAVDRGDGGARVAGARRRRDQIGAGGDLGVDRLPRGVADVIGGGGRPGGAAAGVAGDELDRVDQRALRRVERELLGGLEGQLLPVARQLGPLSGQRQRALAARAHDDLRDAIGLGGERRLAAQRAPAAAVDLADVAPGRLVVEVVLAERVVAEPEEETAIVGVPADEVGEEIGARDQRRFRRRGIGHRHRHRHRTRALRLGRFAASLRASGGGGARREQQQSGALHRAGTYSMRSITTSP